MEWETYINTRHNTSNCQAHLPSGNHLLFHSFTFLSSVGVVTTCSSFRGHTFCFLFVFYASSCDLDSTVCEILFPSFKAYLAKPLGFFTLSCCFFFPHVETSSVMHCSLWNVYIITNGTYSLYSVLLPPLISYNTLPICPLWVSDKATFSTVCFYLLHWIRGAFSALFISSITCIPYFCIPWLSTP